MKKKKNGFTLIEMLAVIVILITILLVAIPSITSSLERSKDKQKEAKKELIVSSADIYVSNHKNNYPNKDTDTTPYVIAISELRTAGLVDDNDTKDSDGNEIAGVVCFWYYGTTRVLKFSDSDNCSGLTP